MIGFVGTESERKANTVEACGCSGRKRRNKISAAILAHSLLDAHSSFSCHQQHRRKAISVRQIRPQRLRHRLPIRPPASSETSSITVLLNGEPVAFECAAERSSAGTTFVPLRSIFEQLGVEVEWNQQRQEALLTSGREAICLKVDSKVAIRNTEVSSLTDAALSEGRPRHGSPALSERVSGV